MHNELIYCKSNYTSDQFNLSVKSDIGLNRYSVRLLGSAKYQLLGNIRYTVVTSLPKQSIEKIFEQQFIHLSSHL